MNEKRRGYVIFVAVILSLLLLAPLGGDAAPREGGGTVNDIYFGFFRYMKVRSEMKEPHFTFTRHWAPMRVVCTGMALGVVWGGAVWLLKRKPPV